MNADAALAALRDAAAHLRRLATDPADPELLRAIADTLERIAAEAEGDA